MKNKLIAAVAVVTLSGSLAIAAPHGGGKFGGKHGRRGTMGMRFAEKLNLSDAQKEQIKAIHRETREQNQAFFESFRETRQQLRDAKKANDTARADSLKATAESQRSQMKQIRDAERQRVLAVLTPEQRTQFEQMQAQRGERRHGKRGDKQ